MKPTKLNIGCGARRIEGYTGVDAVKRPAADIVAPADKIPLKSGTIDEILAVHLVEHVFRWQTPLLLREWARLLRPGGLLVLEMPDLLKCCANIINNVTDDCKHPDQLGLWGLFGDDRGKDPYMAHRTAWTFTTLRPLVAAAGFKDITEHETQFHPIGRGRRDFRLEAIRS